MPVSLELILIGLALLFVGLARLRGKRWGWLNRGTAKPGPREAAKFDWKSLSMTLLGSFALGLGLTLVGIDLLNALFTWLKR